MTFFPKLVRDIVILDEYFILFLKDLNSTTLLLWEFNLLSGEREEG